MDDSNVDEYFDNTQNEVSDAIDDLPSRDEDEKAIQIDSLTIPSGAKDVSPNTKQMIRDRSLQAKEAALKDLKEAYVPIVKYNHLSLEKVQLNGFSCE